MRVGAATYGVGGVKERGMEVEREGGGQYQVADIALHENQKVFFRGCFCY